MKNWTEKVGALRSDPEFDRLCGILESLGTVVVAYSGGVDSAFLLLVARAVLGDRARAVLGVSDSVDRGEFRDALSLAEKMGAPVDLVETREFENPDYRRNAGDRCYHCKAELFTKIRRFADQRSIAHVLDGSHAGDRGDYRPGFRARNEQGVRSPLMEAGLDKEQIRYFSRLLGLPTWDKPAAPCLSSRVPYGDEVTPEKLRSIEESERCLRELGFRVVRVRHHGQVARIEVESDRLADLLQPDVLPRVVEGVRAAGFLFVTVDLEGFRSGSLNQALSSVGLAEAEQHPSRPSSRLVQVEPPPPAPPGS